MALTKYKLGNLLELSEVKNENLEYGIGAVKGISIQKVFIETKADMTGVSLRPYYLVIVSVGCFQRKGGYFTVKQPYNTALYMRLSREDENYGDSVSVETQRTILRQYAQDNGLHVVGEYIDGG